jgi:general secretion pathway protein J
MAKNSPGFTLVELLVALVIMALMAVMSWQGLDGMVRTLQSTSQNADQVLSLNAALAQWQTDLDALIETPNTTALDWDGNTLRITRTGPSGVADPAGSSGVSGASSSFLVTAWSLRQGGWQRWQSAPLTRLADWQAAWQQASTWGQGADANAQQQSVRMAKADAWQLFYYRGNAWTNSLSSDANANTNNALADTPSGTGSGSGPWPGFGAGGTGNGVTSPQTASNSKLPLAIKMILTLSNGQTLSGAITRDWVRPVVGGGKS